MHSKSDNMELLICDKDDENIEKPFQLLINRYQIGLEVWMSGSDFISDWVYLLYCKCYK